MCQREAPSASRVATSDVRRAMRTSVSPARLAQAINRMNAAASMSTNALGRNSDDWPCFSETE